MTRTRRPVAVILAGALCCFGVVLVVSYFYYVSPEAAGSIVHTRVLWGGIMCAYLWAQYGHIATYLGKNDGWRQMVLEPPTQINTISTAAMHTPLPRWVISVESSRGRPSMHFRYSPKS